MGKLAATLTSALATSSTKAFGRESAATVWYGGELTNQQNVLRIASSMASLTLNERTQHHSSGDLGSIFRLRLGRLFPHTAARTGRNDLVDVRSRRIGDDIVENGPTSHRRAVRSQVGNQQGVSKMQDRPRLTQ
jgi:hypothetical protein